MTNRDILQTAVWQSAIDCSCKPEDFLDGENHIVISESSDSARRYLTLPHFCNLVSYGSGIVACCDERFMEAAASYLAKYPAEHCFETPNLHVLSALLEPYGMKACFMAEYFLPDVNVLKPLDCGYELRMMTQPDFAELYRPEWSNALCEKRKHLDVLGIGAYDQGALVGFAACSADCDDMWQIGIDVLPAYRRRGIAACLTSRLALAILERGKVPFYCAAWSNIASVRNAIKAGFRPAWAELTAKPAAFVDEMNA